MAATLHHLSVFVAWPGGVEKERKAVFDAVALFNDTYGKTFGVTVEAKDWKTAVRPARGRPQGVINAQIGDYDVWVGIVGTRLGSEAGKGKTGFVEEFEIADARWRHRRKGQKPGLMLYFRDRASIEVGKADLKQLQAVQDFRKDLEGRRTIYFGTYTTPADFARKIQTDLINELLARLHQATGIRVPKAPAPRRPRSPGQGTPPPSAKPPPAPPKGTAAPRPRADVAIPKLLTDADREAFARRLFNTVHRELTRDAKALRTQQAHVALAVSKVHDRAFSVQGQVEGHRAVNFRIRWEAHAWDAARSTLLFEEGHRYWEGGEAQYVTALSFALEDDEYRCWIVPSDWRALPDGATKTEQPKQIVDVLWKRIVEALKQRR